MSGVPSNNFDFLRLLFAILVVVHHCYPLSGVSEQDIIYYATQGKITLSYIGVRGFFVISGYLIFQSLMRSENLLDYFVKRVLRIYPALIVVLTASVLVCVVVYNGSIFDYFTQLKTWTYIPRNLFLITGQQGIPGVFENNALPIAINGSLWTIVYEFTMYVALAPLFFMRHFSEKTKTIILFIILLILYLARISMNDELEKYHIGTIRFDYLIHFALLFLSGSLLAHIKIENINNKLILLAIVCIVYVISISWQYFEQLQFLIFPIIVILFGSYATKGISKIGQKIGDISYGTYIYGFPVQQFIMHYFSFNEWQLLFASLPITLFLGWISWHYIEHKVLHQKKKVYLYFSERLNLSS